MRLPVHQSSRSLKKDTYLIWKKCDEPRIFFEKDNNTFSTFKETNKQKDNKLRIMRLPRQRSGSLAKIIFFEKDNTTHRRTFCFLVRKKMKNPAKLLPKNAHCLGQEEKFLILYCIIKQLYLLL